MAKTSHSSTPPNPAGEVDPKKQKSILPGFVTYILVGAAVTLLLLGGKLIFERSSAGRKAERWTFEFLQTQLTAFDPQKDLPIVVVDIGQQPGGTPTAATSRKYLEGLVGALVERRPSAIAIDEDFSTNGTGWVTDDDQDFFTFCLKMKEKGVPVFLGVHEARAAGADTWLGLPDNKEMAVALLGPKGDPSRMPLWVQYPNVPEKLPSLGSALAREYLKSATTVQAHWPRWAVYLTQDNVAGIERHVVEDRSEYDVAETLVNYSKLELIQKLTLPTINADFIAHSEEMFRDKMVLIGAASYATDASNVPGRDHPFPGVFLHACTAYTLTKEPLYEFTSSFRGKLDIVISAILLLTLGSLRGIHLKRGKEFPLETWHFRIIYPMVFLILGIGIALIRWGHVMWLDFVLVIVALLMHPKVEHACKVFCKVLWGRLSIALGPAPPVDVEAGRIAATSAKASGVRVEANGVDSGSAEQKGETS